MLLVLLYFSFIIIPKFIEREGVDYHLSKRCSRLSCLRPSSGYYDELQLEKTK